jgi:hypothetical protein
VTLSRYAGSPRTRTITADLLAYQVRYAMNVVTVPVVRVELHAQLGTAPARVMDG